MMRRLTLIVVTPLLFTSVLSAGLATPARAQDRPIVRFGLLAIEGPAELAQRVSSELPIALQRAKVDLIAPDDLVQRLERDETVRRLHAQASEIIAQAERHELQMDRAGAMTQARRAVSLLESSGARHHAPALWVRAQLALAQACLLKPSDPECARLALTDAARARGDLASEGLPPRVARLWTQVNQLPPTIEAPDREELGVIARLLDGNGVIWIALRPDGQQVDVEVVVHHRDGDRYTRVAGLRTTPSELASSTARTILQLLRPTTAREPTAVAAQPWYRKWWVWAIVGAVATVATVSTVAVIKGTTDHDDAFTIQIRY